jgi:hypothetical protein
MANDVFDFVWSVPEDGHKWVQAKVILNDGGNPAAVTHRSRIDAKAQWVLTSGLAIGSAFLMKQYRPLKMFTGLFRTFAQIPLDDRGAILAFANQFGDLGIHRPLDSTAPEEPGRLLGVWGETHEDWMQQIDEMRRALAVWDKLQNLDADGLSHFIRWQDAEYLADGRTRTLAPGWVYDSHPDLPPFRVDPRRSVPPGPGRTSKFIEPVGDLFKKGDVLMPALFLLQGWVNNHLKDHVAPRLLYHLDQRKEVLRIVPHNLLGAMWLQLAEAIDGRKKYRTCKECGTWFEISAKQSDHRTARRVFCSDHCKSRDYRLRKDRARELKSDGKSVKDIAKELDTNVETIKKWVAKRKG